MSEPIRDLETAVREQGALPMPVGPQESDTFRFTLDIEGATDREDASWAAEQAVSAVEGQGYKASAVAAPEGVTAPVPADTYPPALPWARLMDDEDLSDFLDELAASAITHATAEVALAEVEDAIARWRLIAEAQHAHNTAPGPDAEELRSCCAGPVCTCTPSSPQDDEYIPSREDRPGMRHAVRTIGPDEEAAR